MTTNPYAAPRANLTDERQPRKLRLAERGTRLGASIFDGLIFGIAGGAAMIVGDMILRDPTLSLLVFGATLGLLGLYTIVLLSTRGQTIGKRMLGIKIVRTDGAPAGFVRAVLLRIGVLVAVGAAISLAIDGPEAFAAGNDTKFPEPTTADYIAFAISIGGVLLIFGAARRCLHDYIAGTIVVKA